MKAFFFLALLMALFALTTVAQENRSIISMSFTTDRPVLQANLTEFTQVSTRTAYDIASYALARIEMIHAVTVRENGLTPDANGNYKIVVGLSFTLNNKAKDSKCELASKLMKYKDIIIISMATALSKSNYKFRDFSAKCEDVPEACFDVDPRDPEMEVGYYCGSKHGCEQFLCLPHYECNYAMDCMSGICSTVDGVKQCGAVPLPKM